MSEEVLSLIEVSKIFNIGLWKKKIGVDSLNISIPKGEVTAIIGPNGSGKSTTLKMIMGFLKPTQGEIKINSLSNLDKKSREKIGYLPENPRFQKFLTAKQILNYYGKLFQLPKDKIEKKSDELLEQVGLKEAANERVQGYSKGMTQRLAFAQALINSPELLILDEPMSGLDPNARIEMRNRIFDFRSQNKNTNVLMSTHLYEDVEQLCSRVLLLEKGKLQLDCSSKEFLRNKLTP